MTVRLRFRHVEAFRAAMLTGSITGAAAKLHVTQPAVSHLMSEMEGILGFALFDRRGGRVLPTANAELLFSEIERCFLGLDHINDFSIRMRRSAQRTIRIAAVPVVSLALLPRAVKRYQDRVGADYFSIHSRISEQVVGWVSSQKVDVGFALALDPVPGVHVEPIAEVRAFCAVPKSHRLAARCQISIHDLADEPFIAMSKSEGVRPVVDKLLAEHSVQPRDLAECPMESAACAMVDTGVGITLIEPFAAYPLRLPNVVFRPFEPAIPITFNAYWLEAQSPSFARQLFLTIIKELADEVVEHFVQTAKKEVS